MKIKVFKLNHIDVLVGMLIGLAWLEYRLRRFEKIIKKWN